MTNHRSRPSNTDSPQRSSARAKASGLATLACLTVLGWLIWTTRGDFLVALNSLHIGWLALAIALGIALTATQGLLLTFLLIRQSPHAQAYKIICAFMASQPSKYVPGKVWPVVIQTAILGKDVRALPVTIANLELFVMALLQMLALGLLCLDGLTWRGIVIALALGPIAGGVLFHLPLARLLAHASPRIATRFGIDPAEASIKSFSAIPILLILLSMALNFAASYCLLLGLDQVIAHEHQLVILATLYLSNILGALVVIVPAGIGVREAAAAGLALILAPATMLSTIVSVALVFRVWQILVDAFCFLSGWAMTRNSR